MNRKLYQLAKLQRARKSVANYVTSFKLLDAMILIPMNTFLFRQSQSFNAADTPTDAKLCRYD
jgi:hypothetical protein